MTANWKTVRVFISSTFRDMHAERDYLSRLVFPELRSRCQKRGAEFIGLDLRWGVTEEEAQREGALKICMDEIERCRPFFVCLLGSRYGWVPPPEEVPPERFEDAVRGVPPITITDWYALDETSVPPVYRLRRDRPIPEDVAETLARFWEDAGLPNAGESITAREILRGVFEEGFPATHALFYLRKPGIETTPAFPRAFVPVFVEQDAKRRAKLENLETKIRECADRMVVRDYDAGFAGLQIDPSLLPAALSDAERKRLEAGVVTMEELNRFSAPVREVILRRGTVALAGLETLGDLILEDLWAAIEKELERPVEVLDDHQRERAYHERFVVDRTRLFLGRDEIVERILDGLADPAGGDLMAVTGAPGSGKSALLAECARQARERFHGALVIPHFIGASPSSAILTNTLQSIGETLKRECSLTEEVPDDPQKLLQKWPELLEKAGARRRIILLLDGLNQLDPLDHSHELGWIPYRMPQGVTLVVSALPGDSLDRLRHRVSGEAVIDVPVLEEQDRRALVREHLSRRRKKLLEDAEDPSRDQLRRLLDPEKRPEAGLPLYLLVALEELSLFGSYEALGERIDLLPATVAELFDQVLARLEHDHGRDITDSICRWIAVSRSGMLESEILDLLAGREKVFPRARWSRFYHALEPYLRPVEEATGAGLLAFYHDQLRLATCRRYLGMQSDEAPPTEASRDSHRELAQYFRSVAIENDGESLTWRDDRPRGLSELSFHQTGAELWADAERTLCDLRFIQARVSAQMLLGLQEDYRLLLRTLPETRSRLEAEGTHSSQMRDYTERIIAYTRRWSLFRQTRARGDQQVGRPGLELPACVVPIRTEAEGGRAAFLDGGRGAPRADRVAAFHTFVASQSHVFAALAGEGAICIQAAWNNHDSGPVGNAASELIERSLATGPADVLLLCAASCRAPSTPFWAIVRTLQGHTREISTCCLSYDGRTAVSGGADRSLLAWDTETGECVKRLRGHLDSILSVSVTPDARLVVSSSTDHTVRVWDLDTESCIEGLDLSPHRANCCHITPDGRRVALGCRDSLVRIWDIDTPHRVRLLRGHEGAIESIWIAPDGNTVLTAGTDATVRLWDVEAGRCVRVLRGHTDIITSVAATPDATVAVSGGWDMSLRIWDLTTGGCLRTIDGHSKAVQAVQITADGMMVASAGDDNTVRLWDITHGTVISTFHGHTDSIRSLSMTPEGRRIASAGTDRTLRIWDGTGAPSDPLHRQDSRRADGCTFAPQTRALLFASPDGAIRRWTLEDDAQTIVARCSERIEHLMTAAVGQRLVTLTRSGAVLVYDTAGWKEIAAFPWAGAPVVALYGTALSRFVAAVCLDHSIHILDGTQGRLVSSFLGHTDPIQALSFFPDQMRVVSAAADATLRIWGIEGSDCLRVLAGHTGIVKAVCVSPDGGRVFSGGQDKTIKVWDSSSGDHLFTLEGHSSWVSQIRVSADGQEALSASWDGTLRLWDLAGASCIRVLRGHGAPIRQALFCENGAHLLSYSEDHAMRLWDRRTGACLAVYYSNEPIRQVFDNSSQGLFAVCTDSVAVLRAVGRAFPDAPVLWRPERTSKSQ